MIQCPDCAGSGLKARETSTGHNKDAHPHLNASFNMELCWKCGGSGALPDPKPPAKVEEKPNG